METLLLRTSLYIGKFSFSVLKKMHTKEELFLQLFVWLLFSWLVSY